MASPMAITTSRPATGERPRSKASMTNQKLNPSTIHDTVVHAKATSAVVTLRRARSPSRKFAGEWRSRSSESRGSRPARRNAKANGRSLKTARTTTTAARMARSTAARTPAARSHVRSGSHGSATNRSRRSESTSKTRSMTTVAVVSAMEARAFRFSATTRAASPARAGRMLLNR
jgi:hypothetical protein